MKKPRELKSIVEDLQSLGQSKTMNKKTQFDLMLLVAELQQYFLQSDNNYSPIYRSGAEYRKGL